MSGSMMKIVFKSPYIKKTPLRLAHNRVAGFFGDDYEEEHEDDADSSSEEAEWNSFGDEEGSKSSLACEDCDYRWEDFFDNEELSDNSTVCPMCGSTRVTEL
jgi:hypothetical protein